MSYTLDGKVANQTPEVKLSGLVSCDKCFKKLSPPERVEVVSNSTNQVFICASYIGTPNFIYESKSGTAVVYCSEYCRNKHNHRFRK